MICNECGKDFKNSKAVYNHILRVHRKERQTKLSEFT